MVISMRKLPANKYYQSRVVFIRTGSYLQSVLLDSMNDRIKLRRLITIKQLNRKDLYMTQLSEKIEQFLDLCASCKPAHDFSLEIVTKCERVTTDYLHALELGNFTYAERAKMSTAERKNRIERRAAKDLVELHEALRKWLDLQDTKASLNMLKQTLGEVRKIERYHANRTYIKRAD